MYYPICVNLKGKNCLVVGGGEVAERKVESLLQAGGSVRLVSPEVTPAISQWARQGKIKWVRRAFQPTDFKGVFLAVAATDNPPLHNRIFQICQKKNILLNVVDVPARCNFIVPAVVRRGSLMLAVSTNGASPGLSKKIRQKLEKVFGEEYSIFLRWMEEARPKLVKRIPTQQGRKKLFERLIDSPVLKLLAQGQRKQAKKVFKTICSKP